MPDALVGLAGPAESGACPDCGDEVILVEDSAPERGFRQAAAYDRVERLRGVTKA